MSDQSIVEVIAEDALDAAADLRMRLATKGVDLTDDARTLINQAFLNFAARHRIAEREACAKVASAHRAPKGVPQIDYDQACDDIEAGIRARSDRVDEPK